VYVDQVGQNIRRSVFELHDMPSASTRHPNFGQAEPACSVTSLDSLFFDVLVETRRVGEPKLTHHTVETLDSKSIDKIWWVHPPDHASLTTEFEPTSDQ